MPKSNAIKLRVPLEKIGSGWHFLRFENKIGKRFETDAKTRRVICTLNGNHTFQCALMPNKGEFCIIVNKSIRDKLRIGDGDIVDVELVADETKYGLPMSEEFREVLNQDSDGDRLFHALTPGKQRSLLHMINSVKDIDRRIHVALIALEHLKENDGNIIGERLYEEIKRPMF